jgi:TonB-linked SusC/RagA family outer membrane protein
MIMKRTITSIVTSNLWLVFMLIFYQANAQTGVSVIHGIVKDNTGEPLPGVSVIATNVQAKLSRTVATDATGKYTLSNLPEGSYRLTFSYIGFAKREVANIALRAGEQQDHSVSMEPSGSDLDEVVVVGYGTQKKVNLTGAVSQIDSKALNDRPIANVTQGLQGVIPNLNINFNNGRPGAEGVVNIRGYASINSKNASPLILIDGVPGDLNSINPRDVETVSVLKDASAAAIYGARGAFGVMLVTTKRARAGKINVNYGNNFGWSDLTVRTDFITDGYDAAVLNDEAFRRATGNSYTGYTDDDYAELLKRKTDKSLPSVVIDNRKGREQYVYYGNTDWWKEMFRDTQTSMEHSLSFTGGNEKVDFLVSGRMYEKNGIMRLQQDKFRKYNLRAKISAEVTKWLTITNNTQFNYANYTYPGWQNNVDPDKDNSNFVAITVHALPSYVPINPDGTATYRTELNNYTVGDGVFADLLHGKSKNGEKEYELVNNFSTVFTLSDKLHITGNYAYTFNPTYWFSRRTQAPWSVYPGVIDYLGNDQLTEIDYRTDYHVLNAFADYQETLGEHHFKLTAGYNQELESYKRLYAQRKDLISDDLNDLNLGTGDMDVSGNANTWALQGFFGRLNYDYKGKYLLELNGRYDGTSRFPDGQRFGFFPSISGGWRVSEESFFEPIHAAINEFKFRASYGSLGNQQEAAVYGYIPLLSRGNLSVISNGKRTQYLSSPVPISPFLTWERAETTNFGIDISAFKSRLSTTFDWYVRNTLDMLIPGKTLPAVYGAATPKQNAGDLRNTGWELSVSWQDRKQLGGKPFGYNIGLALSDTKAEITRFDNPSNLLNNYYVGQELGEIWGYRVAGLFQSNQEAADYQKIVNQDYVNRQRLGAPGDWKNLQAGDVKFIDVNGDGVVNSGKNTLDEPGDQERIGNMLPRYRFGINLGANWAGFDLSVFFQGIGKQDWYPGNNADKFWGPYSRPYYSFIPKDFTNDIWTPENPNAYFPLLRGYDALNDRGALNVKNDRYLQDLAYIRLKNLTIGYSLPAQWIAKAKLTRARVFVSGENLWTATKLRSDYIDPEQASGELTGDINGRTYPFTRTFSLGLDVTF